MFEILTFVLFVWLFVKCLGLAFRLTWSAAKLAAGFLVFLALPVLVLCFLFAGSLMLLLPCLLLAGAWALLKAC